MSFDLTASPGEYRRVADVALQLGVSKQSVINRIQAGELTPVHRFGNIFRIPKSTVDSYLEKTLVRPMKAAA